MRSLTALEGISTGEGSFRLSCVSGAPPPRSILRTPLRCILESVSAFAGEINTVVWCQSDAYVWTEGPRRVTVEVPECRMARAQRESFEVSTVLPLDASPQEVFAGVGTPVVEWLWEGFNAVILSYGEACSGKTALLLGCETSEGDSADGARLFDAGELLGSGGLLRGILRALFAIGSRPTLQGANAATLTESPGESETEEMDRDAIKCGHPALESPRRRDARTAEIVVAISAWEVEKNRVKDLLSPAELHAPKGSGGVNDGVSGGKDKAAGVRNQDRNGGGGGGKGNRRRSRSRSRGRSGSDDSAGWPSGYPDGFATVRAPDLETAIKLVDTALSQSAERKKRGVLMEAGSAVRRGSGGKESSLGHVFFRVVVYKGAEETVSTLHLVDLAGGWEPCAEKHVGKRGNKTSLSSSLRPSAASASRDIENFDTMIAGLVRPDYTAGAQCHRGGGGSSRLGNVVDGKIEAGEESWRINSTDTMGTVGPHGTSSSSIPSVPPAPHPLFGSPKMNIGGGGEGKLVEALRTLVSGNARSWLVVSVGGRKGGGSAAQRVLDVARRARSITSTCIRLRGIALGDLRLLDARKVLPSVTARSPPPHPPPPCKWDEEPGTAESKLGTATRAGHCRGKAQGPAVRFSEFCSEISSETSLKARTKGSWETGGGSDGPEQGEYIFRVGTKLDGDEGTTSLGEFLEGFQRGGGTSEPGLLSGTFRCEARFDLSGGGDGQLHVNASNGGHSFAGTAGSHKETAAATVRNLTDDVGRIIPDDLSTMGDPQRRLATPPMSSTHDEASRDILWRPSALGESTTRTGKCNGSIPGAEAIRQSAGDLGIQHPAVTVAARARNSIDCMVSSMLEDVLPASKGIPTSELAGVAGAAPHKAAVVGHHESPPRAPIAVPQVREAVPLPLPSQPAQVVKTLRVSSPMPRSDSEGAGAQGRLFTPIEVLMHAPAGSESCDHDRDSQRQPPQRKAAKNPATRYENRKSKTVVGAAAGGKQNCHGGGGRGSGGNARRSWQARAPGQTSAPSVSGEIKSRKTPAPSGFGSWKPNGGVIEQNGRCACGGASVDTGADARPKDAASRVIAEDKTDCDVKVVTPSREGRDSHELARGIISIGGTEASWAEQPAAPSVVEPAASKATAAGSDWTSSVRKTGEGACVEGKVMDAEGLERRSNAALLRVIQEQESRAKQMERRFEAKESDWLERVTALEAELEGFRADAVEMKGRLKRAEASSPSVELFARYDAQVGLLEAENAALRDANLSLELRLLDLLRQSSLAGESAPQGKSFREQRTDSSAVAADTDLSEGSDGQSAWAARKFPVDGRPLLGRAAPTACTAALRDLRRRLKEAEREVKELRLQRAAVDRRERQCQARLRLLSEHESRVQDFSLKERQHEAALTTSRLDCARAEAVAETNAGEIDRLLEDQAALKADKEALILELAEERRKSRRFDEDRRAYGHIRRFIEQHAGGRPPEWAHDMEEEGFHRYGRGARAVGPKRRGGGSGSAGNDASEDCGGDEVPDDRVRTHSRGRIFAGYNNTPARPGRPFVAAKHTASRNPQMPGDGYWETFQRGRKLPDEWDEGDDECHYDDSYAETFPARTRRGETIDRANRAMTYKAGFDSFTMTSGPLKEKEEWTDRPRGMTQRDEDRSRGFDRRWHAHRPNTG